MILLENNYVKNEAVDTKTTTFFSFMTNPAGPV
jgi:hypothetical protein